MANKLYNDTSIKAIADAIRAKNGKTDTYTVAEMAGAINDIPAGGGVAPIEETWNIVNSQVQAYLDWVEQNPYSASDYTTSYFDDHTYEVNDDPVGAELTLPAGNLIVTDEGTWKRMVKLYLSENLPQQEQEDL